MLLIVAAAAGLLAAQSVPATQTAASSGSNAEMAAIFAADQADRAPGGGGIDWTVVGPRDVARQARTRTLLDSGALRTGEDYYRAAFIFQHGTKTDDYLLAHAFIPADLDAAYRSAVNQALEGVRHCFARAGEVHALRLHGDCHVGNVLWTDDGPHFVDFDDSRMGPAVQDLWMLLSGERAERVRQLADVLAGYEDFCDFDARELHLVEALRTLRLIHYAA